MIDRMVRALLLGMLATTVVVGCGKNNSAPAAQPGAVAGKVLEVSGAVSVAGQPLHVGDPVKTDDSVETGADGNVVIELAHNQARWELGPNHKVKPSESLAWSVANKTGSAAAVDQATSAAGRPAERSAADTEATTRAAPVRGGADQGAHGAMTTPTAPPAATGAPPTPTAPPATATTTQPSAHAAPPPAPRAEKSPAPQKATDSAEGGVGGVPGGASGGGGGGEDKSSDAVARSSVSVSPAAQLKTLASCVPAGSSVHIKAHIASHTATVSFVGDVDDAIQKCIRAAVPKLTMSIDAGDVDLTLTR